MNSFYKINILVILFITPLWAQLNVSVSTGMNYYDQVLNYETSLGINVGTAYSFHSGNKLGLEFKRNNLKQIIEAPSGTELVPITVSDININYSYLLVHDFFSFNLSPFTSLGLKSFQRSAYSINLGALGNKAISGTINRFFTASLALDISRKIYKQAVLFIRPEISIYDLSNYYKVFSIAGGIDVRLF